MSNKGITTLKEQVELFEAIAALFEAALEDDGKLSLSDLLDKDVLEAFAGIFKAGKHAYDDLDQCLEEIKDLDLSESLELLGYYLEAGKKIYLSLQAHKVKRELLKAGDQMEQAVGNLL